MKRFTLLSLFVLLTICVQAVSFTYGRLSYTSINSGTNGETPQVTCKGSNSSYITSAIIPDSVSYKGTTYVVSEISNNAFSGCNLVDVTIPNSVTTIGSGAFQSCTGLKNVTIPNSVTTIGDDAFRGCTGLTDITISNSITILSCFNNCTGLTNITIPNSVTTLAGFDGCTGLTSIIIPNSVTALAGFNGCTGLTNITIPNSVTTIGIDDPWGSRKIGAFENCIGLTDITIPNSVTTIGQLAFCGCTGLTDITIPNSVTTIGLNMASNHELEPEVGAFSGCIGLTNVTFEGGVTTIGHGAFSGCTALTDITIPNSVTEMGWYAFSDCTGLTRVTISGDIAGCLYNDYDDYWICDRKIFSGCTNLTDVIFTEGVTTIGSLFSYCTGLTNITIPNSVTTIGKEAFSGCTGLTEITIPKGVTSIESNAFSGCTGLTKVTVCGDVMMRCIPDPKDWWECDWTGHQFSGCDSLTDVVFADGVTTISALFKGCTSITNITIPNTVTTIETRAFSDCTGLTQVSIPNSVTTLSGFDGCTGLTDFTIPNSVDTLGEYAFSGCTGLTSITIPNSVTTIGKAAFSGCTGLTSITIPNSVTTIGKAAFSGCTGLAEITIPNSVTSIESQAFFDCTGLTSITIEAITPPEGFIDALLDYWETERTMTIYVPCGSLQAYSQLTGDQRYTFTEPPIPYAITTSSNNAIMGEVLTIQANTCNNDTTILFAQPTIGYHLAQWNDGNTDNPRVVVLTQDMALTAEFAQSYFGQCGNSLYWSFEDDVLTIYGSGDMYDYSTDNVPWLLFRDATIRIIMERGITHIGDNAFNAFTKVEKVEFPNTLLSIGENAFANCRKLYDVYSYAIEPPFAEQSSFSNYNVYVHIPCDNLRAYQLDAVFGTFKYVKCINADSAEADDITVISSSTEAEFLWPSDESADTYTLDIYKDGEVFCTLVFNANGQLNSIAFAPSRVGKIHQAAEKTGNGFRFTVTGLTKDTHYQFNMNVEDEQKTTLQTYTGEFSTGSTALDDISIDGDKVQKIMLDGQIYILKNNKIYTLMGVEVK